MNFKLPWFKKSDSPQIPFEAALDTDGSREPEIDFYSPTWKYVRRWLKDRLEAEKDTLCSRHLDENMTMFKRGRVKAYKDLLGEEPNSAGNTATGVLHTAYEAGKE